MIRAAEIQREREAVNLQNHRERVEWLSSERPRWACGELVDAHSRHVLLLQSQEALCAA